MQNTTTAGQTAIHNKTMKKFESNNEALNELLINNGIDLICNANMEIIISDEDAKRIEELVENMAPAANQDYTITDLDMTLQEG